MSGKTRKERKLRELSAAVRQVLIEIVEPRTLLTTNPIVLENQLPGTPPSVWDVAGGGDSTIQGFATDISVNQGQTVNFKITDTTRAPYHIDIYRMGYYGGMGARFVTSVAVNTPQVQPSCLTNASTGLMDCGNWASRAATVLPPSCGTTRSIWRRTSRPRAWARCSTH